MVVRWARCHATDQLDRVRERAFGGLRDHRRAARRTAERTARAVASHSSPSSEHRLEREERRVLFDVLQAGWSDSTFSAEWARLEAEEEAWAEDGLTVVGAEDRLEGFVGL